jgi:TIR domain
VAAASSGGVFISYRRQEASHLAGRLYDRLADRFGESRVFIDVDTLELGVDFTEEIARKLDDCKVLLAVIGPQWLSASDQQGRRRLDDPNDLVRREVEEALARGVRVIPILVEGARMPHSQDLPESLASLARRNALTVRHESFRYDADRLIDTINRILHGEAPPPVQAELPGTPPARLDEQRFLRSLDDDTYREALRRLFDVASSVGMTFEWGSVGTSIRLHTPDRMEPLTVAWVFPPGRRGWSGLRDLTLGYDAGSASQTPSVQEALSEYVYAVSCVPGATRVRARSLHAYTFVPEDVLAQQAELVGLLRELGGAGRA